MDVALLGAEDLHGAVQEALQAVLPFPQVVGMGQVGQACPL